jgi:uncharacterized membrane protein
MSVAVEAVEGGVEDRRVELLISCILRLGVSVSVALVVAGTVVTFIHHPQYVSDRDALESVTGTAVFPHSLHDVFVGLGHFRGRALVMLGLRVLIATLVLRVAVSIVAFARQRDRTFVVITTVVLAPLALDRSWLPAEVARALLRADLTHGSLYDTLLERCDVSVVRGSERITPVVPSVRDRAKLRLPRQAAAFKVERLAYSTDGPVESRSSIVRGDRYRLISTWP